MDAEDDGLNDDEEDGDAAGAAARGASCLNIGGYLTARSLFNAANTCRAAARSRARDCESNALTPVFVCDARHGSPNSCSLMISRVRSAFVIN